MAIVESGPVEMHPVGTQGTVENPTILEELQEFNVKAERMILLLEQILEGQKQSTIYFKSDPRVDFRPSFNPTPCSNS